MENTAVNYSSDKKEMYQEVCTQLKGLIEGVPHLVSNLANASALLNQAMKDINWVGFYLIEEGKLVLGPFQGKPACIEINMGRGVCGTAAAKDEILLVEDVHAFPGHIACDSASRSEIVIPLHANGQVAGVLDIDSPYVGRFDEEDKEGLTEAARILEQEFWKDHCENDEYRINTNDGPEVLLANLDKLHTTDLGAERIRRNLGLEMEDVVAWCRLKILDSNSSIVRSGKNWYVNTDAQEITVNAYSYTIITAHKKRRAGKAE